MMTPITAKTTIMIITETTNTQLYPDDAINKGDFLSDI